MTRFNSQFDFENELLNKMRTTVFNLIDLSDVRIEKLPFADKLRLSELNNQIRVEGLNSMLNVYKLGQKNPNFMKKMEEALKDKSKGPSE